MGAYLIEEFIQRYPHLANKFIDSKAIHNLAEASKHYSENPTLAVWKFHRILESFMKRKYEIKQQDDFVHSNVLDLYVDLEEIRDTYYPRKVLCYADVWTKVHEYQKLHKSLSFQFSREIIYPYVRENILGITSDRFDEVNTSGFSRLGHNELKDIHLAIDQLYPMAPIRYTGSKSDASKHLKSD